jgi:hypothetical protein
LADNAWDWQNTPIDLNMLFGYYNLVDTNTPIDTSLPIKGLSLNANVYILRYARSFDVDGRNTAIEILQPYADLDASFDNAQYFSGTKHNGGRGDTQLVFAHNFIGGPALTAEQFAKWTPGTFFSGAVTLTTPTGDYDRNRVINIGSNRWVVKPELAFGTPIGPTWLEFNTYVSLYGDNDKYQGSNKLEQKPLYAIESHYSYTINRALWVGLDATYSTGGETRIEGADQGNKQENTKRTRPASFAKAANSGSTASTATAAPRTSRWPMPLASRHCSST